MPRGRHNSTLEKMLYEKMTPEEKERYHKEERKKALIRAREQRRTQNILIAICLVIAFATIAVLVYCAFKYGK